MVATSIFSGAEDLIHRALGLQPDQKLWQKSVWVGLKSATIDVDRIARLVEELHEIICSNWAGRKPSRKNWRLERQTVFSSDNRDPETVLERAIAMLGKRGALENWYNQIPVASGMIDGWADKRAAVDLIRVHGRHVDLVELKWESDKPAYAAFEILRYGLAYLLCRRNREIFGYENKALLQAERVSLQVLAPRIYYEPYDHALLGEGIRHGLNNLCKRQYGELSMTFQFLAFPENFRLPFATGQDVRDNQDTPLDEGPNRQLIEAMNNLQPIWDTPAP